MQRVSGIDLCQDEEFDSFFLTKMRVIIQGVHFKNFTRPMQEFYSVYVQVFTLNQINYIELLQDA